MRIGRLALGAPACLVRFRILGRMPLAVAALVFGFLGPASPASASANDDAGSAELPTLAGTFVTELTPGAAGLQLSCASDTRCTMRLLSAKDRATVVETHQFEPVKKLRDTSMVSYALKYTQDKLAGPTPSSDPDLLAARRALAPLQHVNLGNDDCHDLGSREGDGYMVVCRVQQSPWNRPTILFFPSQLSGCGALFCRYMVLPMFAESRGGSAK